MTRVLICDDHAVVRAGLRLLLDDLPGFDLVGEATGATDVVAQAIRAQPDLVVMDLSMPGTDGLAAMPVLRQAVPNVKILVLTVHDDEAYFFAALQAGAAGYVLKGGTTRELIAALELVAAGGIAVPSVLGRRLAAAYLGRPEQSISLSEREQEMLALIAAGRSVKEIADGMYLSLRSVERYRNTLMSKLGLRNKAELLRYAVSRVLPAAGTKP
ncbi:MAG: response regulator transcription factor [Chloroflexota bacterium]|nr:response regulator transcription factor [Chloroflexota bacterium]